MSAGSFVLALGAVALPLGWLLSALLLLLLPWARRWSAEVRADVAIWSTALPLLVTLAFAVAIAVPALLYGAGLGVDHCVGHDHHAHLCPWHGAPLPASIALLGALAWASLGARIVLVAADLLGAERLGRRVVAASTRSSNHDVLHSDQPLCHVIGVLRPRIVVSTALLGALRPDELGAALAHEEAHVRRQDTRWSAALMCFGSLGVSGPWISLWRDAAEELADDIAARATDRLTLASSLVAVARLRLTPTTGPSLGGGKLERRVLRLLRGEPSSRRSHAALGAGFAVLFAAVAVVLGHGPVHHAVESALQVLIEP